MVVNTMQNVEKLGSGNVLIRTDNGAFHPHHHHPPPPHRRNVSFKEPSLSASSSPTDSMQSFVIFAPPSPRPPTAPVGAPKSAFPLVKRRRRVLYGDVPEFRRSLPGALIFNQWRAPNCSANAITQQREPQRHPMAVAEEALTMAPTTPLWAHRTVEYTPPPWRIAALTAAPLPNSTLELERQHNANNQPMLAVRKMEEEQPETEESRPEPPADYDDTPNATMETKVSGQSAQPKRVGRWTLAQLRQTDGIIPSQAGWNKGDSQKLMTNFGTPRNTSTRVKAENLQEVPEEIQLKGHGEVRLQSGTNRFASQRGMTGFGTGRDVCREGVHVNQLPEDLEPLPEEKIRASDGIVRLQAGTNKYDSQKGMTGFGTARRETTKMVDSKHPEYDHEKPDQSEIPLQSGTNKFASQKGMTGFGTTRRETCRIVDTAHPEYDPESSIDSTMIPYQMGSNKYASQKGMTGFGQPRWEVLDPMISWQDRKSQGMVRLQSGTNRFASQAGWFGGSGFGTPRNTTYEAEAGELPYEDMKKSETIIPSQAGWNKGDSQKGMTSFGAPRDVRGKHLKRIWELEYPEEAEISLDRL